MITCASSSKVFLGDGAEHDSRQPDYRFALSQLERRGFVPVPASEVTIHYSAAAYGASLLRAIKNARQSIFIITFVANNNEFTREIYEAIIEKANAGVPVYFLFDGTSYQKIFHNPEWNPEIAVPSAIFKGTQVRWAEFQPLRIERAMALPLLLYRDHRKLVVIDGERIFAGGYNLNVYSFAPLDKNGNVDAMVEFVSQEAGKALAGQLAETWNRWSAVSIDRSLLEPSLQSIPASPESSVMLWVGNQDFTVSKTSPMKAMYETIFQSARSEIWLVQTFSVLTNEQMQLIKEARKRGIKVNLIFSEDQFSSSMDKAVRYCVLPMLNEGVTVYIYKSEGNALLHYKLAMADGILVSLGSPNFNFRSLYLSNEIAIVTADLTVASQVYAHLAELLKRSRRIDKSEASQWRGLSYYLNYILSIPGG